LDSLSLSFQINPPKGPPTASLKTLRIPWQWIPAAPKRFSTITTGNPFTLSSSFYTGAMGVPHVDGYPSKAMI